MDKAGVQAFRSALAEKIHSLRIKTTDVEGFGEPQIGDTLRVLLPVSDSEAVLTDFMVFSFEADNDLLQLYTTVLVEIGEKYDALVKRLVQWNDVCPFGHFGIVERDRQLYHRYTMPVPVDSKPDDLAERALLLLTLVRGVVAEKYPEAAPFAKGG